MGPQTCRHGRAPTWHERRAHCRVQLLRDGCAKRSHRGGKLIRAGATCLGQHAVREWRRVTSVAPSGAYHVTRARIRPCIGGARSPLPNSPGSEPAPLCFWYPGCSSGRDGHSPLTPSPGVVALGIASLLAGCGAANIAGGALHASPGNAPEEEQHVRAAAAAISFAMAAALSFAMKVLSGARVVPRKRDFL